MDSNLNDDAKDLLIRYGGDVFPNLFRSAKGSIVTDNEGREILDFTSGQMCATLGRPHRAIATALAMRTAERISGRRNDKRRAIVAPPPVLRMLFRSRRFLALAVPPPASQACAADGSSW